VTIVGEAAGVKYLAKSVDFALDFLKFRANELCREWFAWNGNQDSLRFRSRDINGAVQPAFHLTTGLSCGVAVLLAMLKLTMGCRLKPKVAATGSITLSGYIVPVGGTVAKVKAALEFGANTIIVPYYNKDILQNHLTAEQFNRISLVKDVIDVLEAAIEGNLECMMTVSVSVAVAAFTS